MSDITPTELNGIMAILIAINLDPKNDDYKFAYKELSKHISKSKKHLLNIIHPLEAKNKALETKQIWHLAQIEVARRRVKSLEEVLEKIDSHIAQDSLDESKCWPRYSLTESQLFQFFKKIISINRSIQENKK